MHIIRHSLAMSLSLIISTTIIIVCLFFGSITYTNIYSHLLEHLKAETILKEESISRDIQNNFENARINTEQIAYNNEVITYLKTTATRRDITHNPLYPSVFKTMTQIKNSSAINSDVWIANQKVNFYIGSNGIISDNTYDVKKRPWYPVAMRKIGQASYTEPYVDWGTHKMIMSNIIALSESGQIYGFIAVDMELDQLPALFKKYTNNTSEQRFLINKDGQFIYNPDKKMILNEKFNIKKNQLKEYASEILSGKSGFKQITYNNSTYYLSYLPATENGWVIVSLINKTVLTRQLIPFTILLVILFGTTVLFLILFVYITTFQKMKPIKVIADYASIIAAGNLSSNLPHAYLIRKDEMGATARACQIIADYFRKENVILAQKIQIKNQELEQQYKHIMETEKMAALGSLVAGVAHEINTPLSIGLSSASFISKINAENRIKIANGTMSKQDLQNFMEQLNEATQILDSNLDRAAELVKSFKQIAVDQNSQDPILFNLKNTIDGVILSLKHEYKHQGHQILNNCPAEIVLTSFPGAFSQIFTNLIMNSIQHGFINQTNGTMQFDCILNHYELQIIYTDNGIGISNEIIDTIFEPFVTSKRQQGHSGLGMHIVFNIVTQKLNGAISCENGIVGGAKFTINLPWT